VHQAKKSGPETLVSSKNMITIKKSTKPTLLQKLDKAPALAELLLLCTVVSFRKENISTFYVL